MMNEYTSWPLDILFCERLLKSFVNFCAELSPFGFFLLRVPYRSLYEFLGVCFIIVFPHSVLCLFILLMTSLMKRNS